MTETQQSLVGLPFVWRVAAGADRFGEHRGLGVSKIDFKVSPQDENGLLILENTFHSEGWSGAASALRPGRVVLRD